MPVVKKAYYMQNDRHLSPDPPKHLGNLAGRCWRKIIPFLESTKRVERIDSGLIEMYCSQYEIYRNAYDSVKKRRFSDSNLQVYTKCCRRSH